MKQKTLSRWLKLIIVGVGLVGLLLYGEVFPSLGKELVHWYPEFAGAYWPWLIFIILSAIPCYGVLICGWMMAAEIGMDRSFSRKNAVLMLWVCGLAAGDSVFFLLGNIALWLIGLSHPSVLLASLMVVFGGASVAVLAAGVSHLVYKAALMKEENELTI